MRLPRFTKMPDNGMFLQGVATPAALGSTQADGKQLVGGGINHVSGADGTKGVVLPSAQKGLRVEVFNTSSSSILKVYPFAGDSAAINSLAADAAFSVAPGAKAVFTAESKTQWRIDGGGSIVSLASGTPGAQAGAIEFDGNAFFATAVAGAKQMVDAEQYCILGADFGPANNTGLDSAAASKVFNSSTNGAITLVAGKTYAFEAVYMVTNTGTTSHTWAVLFGGTATFTALGMQAFGISAGTANAAATGGLTGFGTGTDGTFGGSGVVVTAASTSATEQVFIQLTGTFVVNAGGTLIPQLKASARPGATGTPGVTVKRGSFFRIWETGGEGTVGNWS